VRSPWTPCSGRTAGHPGMPMGMGLISMPSTEVFDAQDESYRESVLPRAVSRRLAIEAGTRPSWRRYVGGSGRIVGIERLGGSGKGADVFAHFGFAADNIVQQFRELLEGA
jgi:transketolase